MSYKEKKYFNWELSISVFLMFQLYRFETRDNPFTNFEIMEILITILICSVVGWIFSYKK